MWLGICNYYRRQFYSMLSTFFRTISVTIMMTVGSLALAQGGGYDVFVPISKYMASGDVDCLSAWFDDNLDITIISSSNNSSRNQAKQILKTFFSAYSPRSFYIDHKAGRANMRYALGSLNAGGEKFIVTIYVSCLNAGYKIQQLKIERLE